ncbi:MULTISPECIES: alpha/beta hydrolase [unclassified Crossiella]|uniref:alpha/beta hydrolase n=1 Tax=unclassified Crossiella TaxID=2620835 RepID=UPI001FFE8EEA|nr:MULTISPECIES: alpha/beta hydrolase [unclassified Crossiella]MCK2238703.1 alpha/beta hydrolase [Crossiella sp. S99.2]MCK2251727.1 alpha/beta hydrolase [Crossiella sp. S99.1]
MVSIDVPAFYREWATRSGEVINAAAGEGSATLADTRLAYRKFFQDSFPAPDGVTFDAVDADGVAAEWATPADAVTGRHLIYLHGGAYLVGDPQGYRGLVGTIAQRLRARVLVPDYRLAPEAVFPAAVEDAVTAYRWLLAQGARPEHVVVAGDSAGGAMAISALVAARDQGLPLPAASIALSPWANLEHTGATMRTLDGIDPSVNRAGLRRAADLVLGNTPPNSPLASPVFADTRGLPPVLIQIGGHEVMLSDAIRLAAKLAEDAVPVRLDIAPRMGHVWHLLTGHLPAADKAIANAITFAQDHLPAP